MADAHANFAFSLIATAPSPTDSGLTLDVTTGDGALFPTPPFNATIWPTGAQPSSVNAEIVRVLSITTDSFTVLRAQEDTTARTILVGDQIAETITAKTLTDVEDAIPAEATGQDTLDLLAYAFRRIAFLESALGIAYGPQDELRPSSYALISEQVDSWT